MRNKIENTDKYNVNRHSPSLERIQKQEQSRAGSQVSKLCVLIRYSSQHLRMICKKSQIIPDEH